MKKLTKSIVCLAILLVVIALTTGCLGKATGGGWFIDEATGNECTFGFNVQANGDPDDDTTWVYKGQFQFKNHGTGEKFHIGEIVGVAVDDNYTVFEGIDKDGKTVLVGVTDLGEPGANLGDQIYIEYDIYGVYDIFYGVIEGGNIQVQPLK